MDRQDMMKKMGEQIGEENKLEREGRREKEESNVERECCLLKVVEGEITIMKQCLEAALRSTSGTEKNQGRGEKQDKRKETEEEWDVEGGVKKMKRNGKRSEVDGNRESNASPLTPHEISMKVEAGVEDNGKSSERMGEAEMKKGEERRTVPSGEEGDVKWSLPSGVESDVIGAWVSDTLSSLLQEVVDPLSPPPRDSLVVASCLLEYTWQQLNIGESHTRAYSTERFVRLYRHTKYN